MPLESKRTVQVHGIAPGTTKQEYLDFVKHLSDTPKRSSISSLPILRHLKHHSKAKYRDGSVSFSDNQEDTEQLITRTLEKSTFSLQDGKLVGTIPFPDPKSKEEAIARHRKNSTAIWSRYIVKDDFGGVTVLYQCPDVEDVTVDICAVHGLGGNAMDTWTTHTGEMWLRDFLPNTADFGTSRIMTFGYDSNLRDKRTTMTVKNWAETLLHSLNEIRTSEQERTRPLLFVAHSLGGLVVRQAMSQLTSTDNCEGITLSNCGIVFLATPHTGSTTADWSHSLLAVANAVAGVRLEIVDLLKSFNSDSVWDKKAFLRLEPQPPFRCFAEDRKTSVGSTEKHIVTQASATLDNDKPARSILGTDHKSICKFSSNLGPFVTINKALVELFTEVTVDDVPVVQKEELLFGHPRFLAHAYPPQGDFWWEGNQLGEVQHRLASPRPFCGRSEELASLRSTLETGSARPKLTVIKGIAGMGKTELLSQFAATQKGRRNVFFMNADAKRTAENALAEICMTIGFDMIEDPAVNQDRWRNSSIPERIQVFMNWLGHACNTESILMVDDIEAFGLSNIRSILKYPAQHLVVSTRDSNLITMDRECREIRLPRLGNVDVIGILRATLDNLRQLGTSPSDSSGVFSYEALESIARILHGHPLAAKNAMPFIMDRLLTFDDPSAAFLELFESPDLEERASFLTYTFEDCSLWNAFNTSLQRLQMQEQTVNAVKLTQLLPYLDSDCIDDILKIEKRWLRDCETEMPDVVMLKSGYGVVSDWLSKLRGVSFYVRSDSFTTTKALEVHPLVMQYLLLQVGETERASLLRQVLRLFHEMERRGARRDTHVRPHVLQCLKVCRELGIPLNSLGLSSKILHWAGGFLFADLTDEIEDLGESVENPFLDTTGRIDTVIDDFARDCVLAKEILARNEKSSSHDGVAYRTIEQCRGLYKQVKGALGDPEELPEALRTKLGETIVAFEEIVKRSGSIYPELPSELAALRKRLDRG